jgi:hypothetical protein
VRPFEDWTEAAGWVIIAMVCVYLAAQGIRALL